MNKLYLMLLWPPAVFFTYPPIYAGPVLSVQKPEVKKEVANDDLSKEIANLDLSLPAPLVKRTDIKKLMETGIATTVVINGYKASCDVPGCTETPTSLWVDSESGCRSCRCDKHK